MGEQARQVSSSAFFVCSLLLIVSCGEGCGRSEDESRRRQTPVAPTDKAGTKKKAESKLAEAHIAPELLAYLRQPSRLKWSQMEVGNVGALSEFEVFQVIDSGAALVRSPTDSRAEHLVMLRGVKTSALNEGSRVYNVPFRVTGVETYATTSGRVRSVPLLRLVPPAELAQARQALAGVIARERERLEEQRCPQRDTSPER